jgi:DUF2924 family protein
MRSHEHKADGARTAALASVTHQLAELVTMSSRALAQKYLEVLGEPTRSNNRNWMLRKIAWKLQENAAGGLSAKARTRIAEIGDELPLAWRMRQAPLSPEIADQVATGGIVAQPAAEAPADPQRDPRLPAPGTVLSRIHNGIVHQVTVQDHGFEFEGKSYRSLSQVAKAITGTAWNGFGFFERALAEAKAGRSDVCRNGKEQ